MILVNIHRNWLDDEPTLMRRVADVVAGRDTAVAEQASGYAWSLCVESNDWKAEIRDGKILIFYRYGSGRADMMRALAVYLTWVLR